MRPGGVLLGLLLGLGGFWSAEGVFAQTERRLVAVDVSGTQTIAKETILARVQTRPGMLYEEAATSEDIRRIFALGYFTDVRAELEELPTGLRLTFVVSEKPGVEAVEIQGYRVLRKKKVEELFGVTSGTLFDARKIKEGIERLKAEYARKGFSDVEILSEVTTHEARNTATIHLLIDEGPRMRITRILIEGNEAFSDRRVRKAMKTKTKGWFRRGAYNEQVLEEDLDRVAAFYRKHGYQDVAVSRDVFRDPKGRDLYVHVAVQEGLQHRVGHVAIAGNVLFPERELRQLVQLKPGAVYSGEGLQEDLRQLKEYYGDRGYINAQVRPDTQLDEESKRVNLTYEIVEHELVYVNRIDVRGNYRTKDVIVRRELRIYPGEAFDGKQIRKSIDRLYNLGFFEEVNVETEPTDDRDREDLVVQVKETKTGSFSIGGGFSSVDRLVGLLELEQRNFDLTNFPTFTGAGQDLRLRAEVGTVRRFFDLSFTEPWIFGHPLAFGVDIFNRTRLRSGSLGLAFEEKRRGAGVRLGKEFADLVNVGWSYQFFRTDISDVAGDASADLQAEQGRSSVSVTGLSVSVDGRNNRFNPTSGWFLFSSGDLAGGPLAGDEDFYRLQGGGSHYWPHFKRFVFESRIRGGIVNEYSNTADVPIFERFFAGGANTIRGFRERRVGPQDPRTNDPIGGEAMFVATAEEVMTLLEDERGRPILKGSMFYDVGNVWRRIDSIGESFKSGAGVGARVNTPIGPVRLDIGYPISDVEEGDRKPRFHFNISRSF